MVKFVKALIISSVFLLFIFAANFIVPAIPSKVYSFEKKAAYNKILECASDYTTYETVFCKIHYTETDKEYINLIANATDTYYPLILKEFDLNVETAGKPTFVIFPDEDALTAVFGYDDGSAPMGVYCGGVINVLSPETWIKCDTEAEAKDKFLKEGPIIHELVHLAVDIKARGNYPVWFTEGVALYYENKFTAFEWRPDLNEVSRYVSLSDLENNFRDIDEGLAYRGSFNLISGFTEMYGENSLQKILLKLGNGDKFSSFNKFFDFLDSNELNAYK